MKRKVVVCPICGKINKIINGQKNYRCTYCKNESSINESEVLNETNRDLEYIENCFKNSVLASDYKNIEKYTKVLLNKESNNIYANYYNLLNIEKRIEYLKNNNISEDKLYFIIKNDIIKNKTIYSNDKIEIINKLNDENNKKILLQYLNNKEDDDLLLKEELYKQEIEVIEYKGIDKERYIGIFMLCLSMVLALIITLVCSITINDNCKYASIVVLGLIPCLMLQIALIKIINLKNVILKILMFVALFYILTYIMTIHLRDISFINSFKEHLNGIIYAIPDILDSITDGFKEGLGGEGK